MKPQIYVTKPSLPPYEEYISELKAIWSSHCLTNAGEKHKQLEKNLKDFFNVSNLILMANGHLSLENTLMGMHLQGEVITTPFTFASTTHAIVRNGLTPVFCDIKSDDYTIDPEKIEALITPATSAILPVHVYGHICDNEAITDIARRYHLKVIYDAAHAFGVRKNGKSVAEYGDASIYSFHATKVFHTIEGGCSVVHDPALEAALKGLRNFGFSEEGTVEIVGGNAKLNELEAAMGICNLRYFNEEQQKRKSVYERYRYTLYGLRGIRIWDIPSDISYNYAYFPIVFSKYKYTRDEIFNRLRDNGIIARKYFYPLTADFPCYKGKWPLQEYPIAKGISDNVLSLPIYPDLPPETVDFICKIILE